MIDVSIIQNAAGAFVDNLISTQVVKQLTSVKNRITSEIANEYGKVETKGRVYFDPRMNPKSISPGRYQIYLEVDAGSINAEETLEAHAQKREMGEVIWSVVKEADWPVPMGLMTIKVNTKFTLERGTMSHKVRFTALIDHDKLPLAELKTETLKSIVAMAAETPQPQVPDTDTDTDTEAEAESKTFDQKALRILDRKFDDTEAESKTFDSSEVNAKTFSASSSVPDTVLSTLHDHFQELADVEEAKRTAYVSYKTRYTFLYCLPRKNSVELRINLTQQECEEHGFQYKVNSHFGQCKGKIVIRSLSELETWWPLIEKSYEHSKEISRSSQVWDESEFQDESDAESFLERIKSRGQAI